MRRLAFAFLGGYTKIVEQDDTAPKTGDGWQSKLSISWPRAPAHFRLTKGCVMVTGATYHKERFFADGRKLKMLHNALLDIAPKHEWHLQAWAVFPNHYHFVGLRNANDSGTALSEFITELHSRTAAALNRVDGTEGRKVWHNYWETELTFQSSYFARLNYVHQNAVKHGIVLVANQYPYCSAGWFENTAARSEVATIYSFGMERLRIEDDY